jgi:hypothetical protein
MKHVLLLLLVGVLCSPLNAQTKRVERPQVILMMLNESLNQIEALKKRGRANDIPLLQEADREINQSIIADFTQYFSFCPVYYFYNRDYDYVKNRQWDKVIFYDAEHISTPKKIELGNLQQYVIAEVNYVPMTNYTVKDTVSRRKGIDYFAGEEEYASTRDYSLLLYTPNFELLSKPLGITNISLRRNGNILQPQSMKYRFRGAEKLNAALFKYFP